MGVWGSPGPHEATSTHRHTRGSQKQTHTRSPEVCRAAPSPFLPTLPTRVRTGLTRAAGAEEVKAGEGLHPGAGRRTWEPLRSGVPRGGQGSGETWTHVVPHADHVGPPKCSYAGPAPEHKE